MQNERKVVELNLSDVLPNRFQPRIKFDENAINELALSIQKYGVIQPIVVRQIGNKYEIIAGERRYKASKVAGKQTIPAIISELNDKDSVEIALIENVQREDLTPIEKAVSYKKILDMGYINQEELAKKVGKSQSAIANTLRLLNLSDDVQEALLENKISERHARSLLKIKDEKQQVEMLNRIINERLTVRKTDEEIDKMLNENNQVVTEAPEEIVQIPDTAMNAPGFMNIDAIENNAKDIIQPEKPVANIDQLLQNNNPEPPAPVEPTGKFFNFFDETPQSNSFKSDDNQFKLENFFNNFDVSNDQSVSTSNISEAPTMPSAPVFETPSIPEAPAMSSAPVFETPSIPEAPTMPSAPVFETPSIPEEPTMPSAPVFEAPSMPEAPTMPSAPVFETPSMPEAPTMPSAPVFETPSIPEAPTMPSAPVFEAPSIPEAPTMPSAPVFETPSLPEAPAMPSTPVFEEPSINETTNPTYEVPISSNVDDIPVIDKPIEPTLNVGNTNVEIFNKPIQNISEQSNVQQVKAAVPNMKIALNTIRECQNTLEKYGFAIDVEEIDFEDSYQVIFKIEK